MQDASGHIYWSLATAQTLRPVPEPTLVWDSAARCLHLQSSSPPDLGAGNRSAGRARAARPTWSVDSFGTWARASNSARRILAASAGAQEREIWVAPGAFRILDMVWTAAGHLLVATAAPGNPTGKLFWLDRLERFDPVDVSETGLRLDRICVHAATDTVWCVDRAGQQARRLVGTPIPDVLDRLPRSASVFAPKPEMADPPRLEMPVVADLAGHEIIDAAQDDTGALLVLRWPPGAAPAQLQRLLADGTDATHSLTGAVLPHSLVSFGAGRVAVAVRGWAEARAYPVPLPGHSADVALPLGVRLPLRDWVDERFCTGAVAHAQYRTRVAEKPVRRLAPVSFAAFAPAGEISLQVIDSGQDGFVWHKLCVDAVLPEGARLEVHAMAEDTADSRPDFHLHSFGDPGAVGVQGLWQSYPSERPWLASPLPCAPQKDRAGLFECALQKGAGDTRRMTGRFLRLRLRLTGGGRVTPRLFALRAYGNRFSWRDRFLPELFRIEEGPGAAGSDFLDRFLTLFETSLTQTEGQIAHAHRLANPHTIPQEGLEWLAGWVGVVPDGALGAAGKRRLIANAARLAPWRGTLRGLAGMLDVVSDGGVQAGRIVVVENYRMRRTFATILGANLEDSFDPLTRGTRGGAQSHLGPGFFLSAADEKRLFALFAPALLDHALTTPAARARAQQAVQDVLEDGAHKVTVLVHGDIEPDQRALIDRVIQREKPAHVLADVFEAPGSLILGLTALLGVETHVSDTAPTAPGALTLGASALGASALGQVRLRGTPALDDRI